jgi:hypothetical protein
MLLFAAGVVAGMTIVAILAAPFWLPWPARMRWILAMQAAPDPLGVGTGTVCAPLSMQEVVLRDIVATDGRIELEVLETRHASSTRRLHLSGRVPAAHVVAALEGWSAVATPLLLWYERDGLVHLYGPHAAVTSLRLESTTIGFSGQAR